MKCKKIQDLIAAGYLDGELDLQTKSAIDTHVSSCKQCRLFHEAAVRLTVEPFKRVTPVKPPEEIWAGIENALSKKKERISIFNAFKNNLQAFFYIPKPAYIFATVMVIMLCVGIFTKTHLDRQELYQAHLDAENEAFARLFNGNADQDTNNGVNFDTIIERYFM